jgi:hypothetical protein
MPVCWATTAEIAAELIGRGALLNGEELRVATGNNYVDVLAVFLQAGAPINPADPQYLYCRSREAMDTYVRFGIDINGADPANSNLLHNLAWINLIPEFDHAFTLGVEWTRDSSGRNPYDLAKQGRRTEMVHHLREKYAKLTAHTIEAVPDLTVDFGTITHFMQVEPDPRLFLGWTGNAELLLFEVNDELISVKRKIRIDVPGIRNVTVDSEGRVIVPTGDEVLLRLRLPDLSLIDVVAVSDDYTQITFLPARKLFLASSNDWAFGVLNEDLQLLHHESLEFGVLYPRIHETENLFSVWSYNQDTCHLLYELTGEGKIRAINEFIEEEPVGEFGISLGENKIYVGNASDLSAFTLESDQPHLQWVKRSEDYGMKGTWNAVTVISPYILAAGNGNRLLLISRASGNLVSFPKVDFTGEIVQIIQDVKFRFLMVRTKKEMKVVPVSRSE